MVQLKKNLLSVALASATLMIATVAHAQSAQQQAATQADEQNTEQDDQQDEKQDPKTIDTVTVVGIRAGIEDAIQTKKQSTSIVESISAEDIGKLPDVSIAESIARLPGVTAQRVAGRAQVISVRGFSPDFSTTLLNGRELVSTGDNRSVEFDQYPAELMSGVTVYKTPDAGLVGQGLSGTLDMHTVRPLNYDKRVFAVSARLQENSLGSAANADDRGERISASYIDQFFGGTLGLAIGFSHSDTPIHEDQVGLYEPWQAIGDGWRPGVPAGTYYSDGIKALRRTGYVRRNGAMATLELRPYSGFTSTLDIFHSQAVQEDTANQFEVHLGGYNGGFSPGLSLTNVQVNGNKTFVGGTASGVYPLVRGMYNKRVDDINAVGWNNEITVGQTRITADMSWSKAHRDELNLENNTQLLPGPQLDSINLRYTGNGFSMLDPGRDYSNPNSLFLANTIYGSGYGKTPKVVDELKSFKLNANFAAPEMLGFLADVDVGANYADRAKSKRQPEAPINLGPQGATTVGSDLQYDPVNLGFAGVGFIPSWNVPGAVGRYMTFEPNENAPWLISKAWSVDEEITSGWLRANIDTQWGSVPVRGNVGVQVQQVDQSSAAKIWDHTQPAGSEIRPFSNGKSYTDVLPSLNLAFSLPHDQTLRLAAARQVARARLDQLRASLDFFVDTPTGKPSASGGNPQLDPWRANAFDVSYEKYFDGTKGYVSAAAFYKDLRSYIYTQKLDGYDFTSFVANYVPPSTCTTPAGTNQPCPAALRTGELTVPYNGQGGHMLGLELTASLPLELLWAPLQGFGVIASASFTDSNITIPPEPGQVSSVGSSNIKLPGLSDEVYNLTAYYTRGGFEARISNRRRSDFIGEVGNFAGERQLRYVVGEDITDAQVSYAFGGGMQGLSLLLQAYNLGNSSYQTYAQTKDRPLENIEWGRTYLLGVNFKF